MRPPTSVRTAQHCSSALLSWACPRCTRALLVLNLTVPAGTADSGLGEALRDLEPELFAYALTVLVLGAFWLAHHRLFVDVPGVTERVLWLNVLYLGFIALLPFPTDVLGSYGDLRPAVVLYAAAIGAVSLAGTYLEIVLVQEGLFAPIDEKSVERDPIL